MLIVAPLIGCFSGTMDIVVFLYWEFLVRVFFCVYSKFKVLRIIRERDK